MCLLSSSHWICKAQEHSSQWAPVETNNQNELYSKSSPFCQSQWLSLQKPRALHHTRTINRAVASVHLNLHILETVSILILPNAEWTASVQHQFWTRYSVTSRVNLICAHIAHIFKSWNLYTSFAPLYSFFLSILVRSEMLTHQSDFIIFEAKFTKGLTLFLGGTTGNKGKGRKWLFLIYNIFF